MEIKYQGINQPTAKDMKGNRVFPYDVVIIRQLADFMIGADDNFYDRFLGCPGMLLYQNFGFENENIYWYDESGEVYLNILCKNKEDELYYGFGLSFPLSSLEKVEQNSELTSLFIGFSDSINKNESENGSFFNYQYIEKILQKNDIGV